MGHFGTSVNPAHFIETPAAGSDITKPITMVRPAPGTQVAVKDAVTGNTLDPIVCGLYGYFAASYPGVDAILLSTDGGQTWIGPLVSAEATQATLTVRADAIAAATDPQNIIDAVTGSPDLIALLTGPPGTGNPGANGAPGPMRISVPWTGVPQVGVASQPFVLFTPTVIKATMYVTLKASNQSTTPATFTLLLDGADIFGANAPSVSQGQAFASGTLPGGDITAVAGQSIQVLPTSFGSGSGGTPTAPLPRTGVGSYASGVNGAPVSTTAATVPLPPIVNQGDYLEMKVVSTQQPTTPSGWIPVGSPIPDSSNNFYFSTRYRKVAGAAESPPTVTFVASAGCNIAIIAIPNVEGSNPIDQNNLYATQPNAGPTASTPTTTTDATTTLETAIFSYETRFAASSTPVLGTVTTNAALTVLYNQVTSRGTSANLGLCIAYRQLSTAATVIPQYAGTLTNSAQAKWIQTLETLRPAAPSNPGSDPTVFFDLASPPTS